MFKHWVTTASLLAGLCAAPHVAAQQKWDLPTAYPASNHQTEIVRQFAADVEKLSNGKLKITVHDNGSLFKGNEIKRAVQGGQAEIGDILISSYSNEDPIFGIDSVPFLATSYADAKRLWEVSRAATEAHLAKQGMNVLYAVTWPPQGIFSAKPINSIADLKGVKWRAYNPNTSRIAQLIGAQPVTIQAAELSQALATGAVSAFITSGATGSDSKIWEQVKYYYEVNAWLPKNLVIVSRKAFDALEKPVQEAVLKAAAIAEANGWKISEEKNKHYKALMLKNGMAIEEGSAQLRADLQKVGETMAAEWVKKAGAEGQALINAVHKKK